MKKYFFFAAIAAIGLASCSSDETIASQATNASNEISFRPLMNGVTRSVDILNADNLKSFKVTAFRIVGTTPTPYFADVTFTGPTTYTSNPKYYWPTEQVNFYAWSAHNLTTDAAEIVITGETKQVSGTYNELVVTPAANATDQADLVYASSLGVSKAASIPLTFHHAGSRIVLKVKNTAANLSFAVSGWKLGFMVPNGTYSGTAWSNLGTATENNVYTNTFTAQTISPNTSTANVITGADAQIMIPQGISPVTAYSGAASTKPNNAYIAVKYTATNTTTSETLVSDTWAIWKLPAMTWAAGYQYNYTIDLADGGYYEINNDGDTDLDPVLGNAFIQFAGVTVTPWTETEQTATY